MTRADDVKYKRASHMMPNRIYPLYRLMKLHEQECDSLKALSYAYDISHFKEKVPSPAVAQIKREAHELINRMPNKKILQSKSEK